MTFNIGASDTLVSIAAGLANAMNGNANLLALGVTAKNSDAADLAFSQSFSGNGTVPSNASLANVSATDAVPTTKTNANALTVTASASSTLTWDANGNMTSDGTNTYKWDAENRLIEIDYPGSNNYSQFSYDGLGRNTRIVETTSGSVTGTKQFVWSNRRRCEARDGSSNVVANYFGAGQKNLTGSYFYSKDHLGTTRVLTDLSSIIQAEYSFDPFGRRTVISESIPSEFQYAGYYLHSRSLHSLTLYRHYISNLAIWPSRDPKNSVIRPYAYVAGNPIRFIDPLGLGPFCKDCAPPHTGESGTSSGSDGTGNSGGSSGSHGGSSGASGAASGAAAAAGASKGSGTASAGGIGGAMAAAAAAMAAAMNQNNDKKIKCDPEPDCKPGEFDPVDNYQECLQWCKDHCSGYDFLDCEDWCWDKYKKGK
ncbi:MAG: hypothetical protein IT343_24060 [Candidatus Melainabacteria bacterium]|nr:hypothetical protein [Candidatus Melainabacteria bacterium]